MNVNFDKNLDYKKWYFVLFHIVLQFVLIFVTFILISVILLEIFDLNTYSLLIIVTICAIFGTVIAHYLTKKYWTLSNIGNGDKK